MTDEIERTPPAGDDDELDPDVRNDPVPETPGAPAPEDAGEDDGSTAEPPA